MSWEPKIKIESVAYHRNGVSGEGFFVVLFKLADRDYTPVRHRNMVATCFFDYTKDNLGTMGYVKGGNPRVAVLDRDSIAGGVADNCFRGDNFADLMFEAVKLFNAADWNEKAAVDYSSVDTDNVRV